jgi:hypothetical protein
MTEEFVFRIDEAKNNLDDIEALIDAMKKFTGARASVVEYFEIRTPDSRIAAALEGLLMQKAVTDHIRFDMTGDAEPAVDKKSAKTARGSWAGEKPVKKVTEKKPRPQKGFEIKSWLVYVGGAKVETITKTEKDNRLAAGGYEPGTIIRHPRAGKFEVIGTKGSPQRLVDALEGLS